MLLIPSAPRRRHAGPPLGPAVVTPRRPAVLTALTGLRIVGAGWVVLHHFQPAIYAISDRLRVLEPVLEQGRNGVPLFFLLSGFIIWHNYGMRGAMRSPRLLGRFLWRRFARLWPVNLLAAVLAVPLIVYAVEVKGYWGAPVPTWYSVEGWLASAMLLGGIADGAVTYPWNQPAWSLTAEMAAYVVFPVLLALLVAVGAARERRIHLPVALLLAGLGGAAFTTGGLFPYSWLVELIVLFVAGAVLRLAGTAPSHPAVHTAQILAPVGVVVGIQLGGGGLLVVAPLLALWVWSLSAPTGALSRLFSTPLLERAGEVSYSVYMMHWAVFGFAALLLPVVPHGGPALLYAAAALTAVGLVSWATWRFVEVPSRRRLNDLPTLIATRRSPRQTKGVTGGSEPSTARARETSATLQESGPGGAAS